VSPVSQAARGNTRDISTICRVERHLMLAKQAMLTGAPGGSDAEKKLVLLEALRHYGMAAKHGSLSHNHLLLIGQLKKRLNT
jgi:hypothetical protein